MVCLHPINSAGGDSVEDLWCASSAHVVNRNQIQSELSEELNNDDRM